ncbi:MAG TPA: divergent polysaccharide deacetylase family protein [Thermoanaerobaculia bacterium]
MRSSFKTIAILAAIPIAGLAAFFLWQWWNGGELPRETYEEAIHVGRASARPQARPEARPERAEARPHIEATPLPKVTPKKRQRSGAGGDIVLIIDDLGFDGQPLDRLMALDPNINASILPNGTRTAEFARRLNARGFEILCHLPMEPRGGETPGRNAILTSMSDDEIARVTRENIQAVPHAVGVNNHMGSRATSDRRVMTSVLRAMPEELYFIDSRTAAGSVAEDVARELNVPTAARHVFLDDVATEGAVRRQVRELAEAAEKRGVAIGIGHPYPVTMRVLAEELPELRARGFRLVRASEVVR